MAGLFRLDRRRPFSGRACGLSQRMTHMPRIKTHPGEVLLEEFMRPLNISANALARDLHVPPNRITAIIATEKPRAVTADTAIRLGRYFRTTPEFWLNLQRGYDLSVLANSESAVEIERLRSPARDTGCLAGDGSCESQHAIVVQALDPRPRTAPAHVPRRRRPCDAPLRETARPSRRSASST